MSLNEPQPPPKPGTGQHSVDALLIERKAMGLAKYGTAHQYDNGRDHAIDALQESLDMNVYLMAEVLKLRDQVARRDVYLNKLKDRDCPCNRSEEPCSDCYALDEATR